MITVSHVYKYFDDKAVIDDVSFSIAPGECVGLIGPSGTGKSVLLKCLSGIYKPDVGSINHGIDEHDISIMFQEGALFDSVTSLDNVVFPLVGGDVPFYENRSQSGVEKDAFEVLASVGLAEASHKLPGQLSGGMRKRLSLARALVNKPKIALLDDPTSGLDPIASSVIMELIREVHDSNDMSTVIVSHDLRRLFPYVDRVVALFQGSIIFDGKVEDMVEFCKTSDEEKQSQQALHEFVSARYAL